MEKMLTGFCFTDIHNQQSMLDYPTTLRKSLIQAKDLAIEEVGLADIAIVGGDNISDYPHWNKTCFCYGTFVSNILLQRQYSDRNDDKRKH